MEENCMIEVVGQLGSDTEAILKTSETGTVVYKHVACQATSIHANEVSVPIMFCTMFSPICEASTQVNLPLTSCFKDFNRPPAVIQSFSTKNRESEPKPLDNIKPVKERNICFQAPTYRKRKYEIDSALCDSKKPDDDVFMSPSIEEDNVEKDPEDSEYSSDNDLAFWQEMKRYAKRKTKTSPPKNFLYKYLPHKDKFENEKIISNSTKCHITVPSYNDQQSALTKEASKKSDEVKIFRKYPPHKSKLENDKLRYSSRNYDVTVQSFNDQQSALIKEGNKKSDEVSNVVNGPESGDDWITDDEVDDEDQESIELAFKREWKAKRLPNHSKEKNFVCEICGKRYAKHTILRTHVVREHKEHEEAKKYPYSCAHCKRVYIRKNQLLLHQQQCSGPCEICGVMLGCSGLFWTHRRNHIPYTNIRNQNQNNNVCKICNRVFHTKGSVYMHMRVKHSNKLVSCPECNRKFPFEFLKKRHIAQAHHNAELIRYMCDMCDFWGLTKRALKIHQKVIHNDSPKLRMYTCDECKAKFNSRIDYNIHVAIHTNKSSIGCPRSSKKFTSQSKLQAKRISTDEINSGKNTVSSQLDNSHVSQYLCALCNITVDNSEDLVQHMHKYHDMDVDSPREIKLELGSVHPLGINENTKSMVQAVGDKEVISQELDRPQNEPANVSFSTDPGCSNARSAMLMPASVVPPNVNMMEIHGVQYHFIRETKYQ